MFVDDCNLDWCKSCFIYNDAVGPTTTMNGFSVPTIPSECVDPVAYCTKSYHDRPVFSAFSTSESPGSVVINNVAFLHFHNHPS